MGVGLQAVNASTCAGFTWPCLVQLREDGRVTGSIPAGVGHDMKVMFNNRYCKTYCYVTYKILFEYVVIIMTYYQKYVYLYVYTVYTVNIYT